MPTFIDEYVTNAMTRYESRHIPRFKNFQILGKKIEEEMKTTTRLWKSISNVVDVEEKEEEKDEDKDANEDKENEEIEEPNTDTFVQVNDEELPEVQTIK